MRRPHEHGFILILAAWSACAASSAGAADACRSPIDVAFSPDGRRLAVSDHTAGTLYLLDAASAAVRGEAALTGHPAGLAWSPDGSSVYVAEREAGTIAVVDASAGRVLRRVGAGAWPTGVATAQRCSLLLVTDFARDRVAFVDSASDAPPVFVAASRQPTCVAVTPDESLAVVTNLIPRGVATDPNDAAVVTLIDVGRRAAVKEIRLPAGSSGVRGVAVDPEGKRAYVAHTVGRTNLPTTQIERGWVNTNAISVIDLGKRERIATVLLDALLEGAADPWGVAVAPDGTRLWVTLSGTHQLAVIDVPALSSLLADRPSDLENEIGAVYRAGAIKRAALPGRGPRGLAVAPDGKTLAVALYFSGQVALLDADTGVVRTTVSLGSTSAADAVRRGERIFHDATYCKQKWLSCATCHPDTRADGMNWDLLNDGLGNPKNVRSLVWSYRAPPAMSIGVRASMEAAVAAGFTHIAFQQIGESDLNDVRAYLRSLEPEVSPYLATTGPDAARIERGREVFHQQTAGCATCHPPPLYTDMKRYDVGTRGELDHTGTFDTPTLVELWRTAPYLHDGSAADLRDVLFGRNKDDRHGITSHLTERQLDDLIAFLVSL